MSGTRDAPGRRAGDTAYRKLEVGVRRKQVSRPRVAALARLALWAAGRVPLALAHHAGGALGRLAGALPNDARKITAINVELCLPELDPGSRARLVRASLAETGRMVAEVGAMWNWTRERVRGVVRETRGMEALQAALGRGRGALVLLPHLGSWELAGLYLSALHPVTALYRPPLVGDLDPLLRRGRTRFGGRLAAAGIGGVRELRAALDRGEVAIVLPDQDPGYGAGVHVPFFGVPANTTVLPARLARSTGAPTFLCWAERLGPGRGYRCSFVAASEELCLERVDHATAALNRDIEALVRARPEQYLWSYMRFRIPPPSGRNPYREAKR